MQLTCAASLYPVPDISSHSKRAGCRRTMATGKTHSTKLLGAMLTSGKHTLCSVIVSQKLSSDVVVSSIYCRHAGCGYLLYVHHLASVSQVPPPLHLMTLIAPRRGCVSG